MEKVRSEKIRIKSPFFLLFFERSSTRFWRMSLVFSPLKFQNVCAEHPWVHVPKSPKSSDPLATCEKEFFQNQYVAQLKFKSEFAHKFQKSLQILNIHMYLFIYLYIYLFIYLSFIDRHLCVNANIIIYICMYVWMYVYIYICMFIYIYIYLHKYIYI